MWSYLFLLLLSYVAALTTNPVAEATVGFRTTLSTQSSLELSKGDTKVKIDQVTSTVTTFKPLPPGVYTVQLTSSDGKVLPVEGVLNLASNMTYVSLVYTVPPDSNLHLYSSVQNQTELPLDWARVYVYNPAHMKLKGVSKICHLCVPEDHPINGTFGQFIYPANWDYTVSATWNQTTKTIVLSGWDGGQYFLFPQLNANVFYEIDNPTRSYSEPLYVLLGIVLGLVLVYNMGRVAWSQFGNDRVPSKDSHSDSSVVKAPSSRVISLDAFRGLSIMIMIFVNYGGGGYWFFDHSFWDGLTVADLVFPWFIWIMGTSMAFSFKNTKLNANNYQTILYKIIRRTIILFALGLFINQSTDIVNIRIPGVLQRFAFSYLIVSLVIILVPKLDIGNQRADTSIIIQEVEPEEKSPASTLLTPSLRATKYSWAVDFLPYSLQWLVILAILALYLILQYTLPVPGCPTGYIGPGGIGDHGKYPNCTGGAARWIDIKFFGINHIYQTPTCAETYKTGPHDPEGLLGSFTSVFLCFLGNQAGRTLVHWKQDYKHVIVRWMAWGTVLGLITIALTYGTQFNGPIPLNKNLWSVSFIFCMGCFAFFLLSFCFLLIDVFQVWSGAPFIFIGMNPILIYCGHEILQAWPPFSWQVYQNTHAFLLFMHVWGVSMWIIIAYKMWYDNFFVVI